MLRRGGHRLRQAHLPTPPKDLPLLRVKSLLSLNSPLPLGGPPAHHWEHIKAYLSRSKTGRVP